MSSITIPDTKPSLKSKKWQDLSHSDSDVWQAKLDGAFVYYKMEPSGVRAFSYRRSKKTGEPIEHTHKIHGLDQVNVPKWLHGSVLRGEAWHPELESRQVGGILNTRREDIKLQALRPALHGIQEIKGMDVSSMSPQQQLKLTERISKEVPVFDLPDTARTPSEKKRLIQKIQTRQHGQTYEGIVSYPQDGRPYKAVIEPTYDVPVVGQMASESETFRGKGVQAILVGDTQSPTRVGTGMSHKMRQVLHKNPDLLKGLVARVEAKEMFPSGKLRSPRLKDFHPEKSDPDAYMKLQEALSDPSLLTLTKESAEKEFAPGIPMDRTIHPIPAKMGKKWELCIQKHDAHRAGTHYDLRLADPETGHAHSWAIPKASLPDESNRIRLAIQQPTHTMSYMDYEGEIPKGTYGAGTVKLVQRAQAAVDASPNRISFETPEHGKLVLRCKGDKSWMLMKKKEITSEKLATNLMLSSFIEKMAEFISHNKPRLNTRLTPFRNDISKKLKPSFTVEAPAKNVVSAGVADSGPIGSESGGNSTGSGAP